LDVGLSSFTQRARGDRSPWGRPSRELVPTAGRRLGTKRRRSARCCDAPAVHGRSYWGPNRRSKIWNSI